MASTTLFTIAGSPRSRSRSLSKASPAGRLPANVFCIVAPLTGRRLTHATPDRTGRAFGLAMGRVARRYADADTIHVVFDNLSTHSEKSLVAAYGEVEGRSLWRRFTVHYTPKHASWLNAAEMEAGLV